MKSFEESFDILEALVERKRKHWRLASLPYLDFDDVKTLILTHIYHKWDQFDQSRPVERWASTIVSNQFINFLRDSYYRIVSPCSRCPNAYDDNKCLIFGDQSDECLLYAKWNHAKRDRFNVSLMLPLDNCSFFVNKITEDIVDSDKEIAIFEEKLFKVLSQKRQVLYLLCFREVLSDREVLKIYNQRYRPNLTQRGLQKAKKNLFEVAKEISRVLYGK